MFVIENLIFLLEWTSCHSQVNTFHSNASEKGVFGYFQKALELAMVVYLESEQGLWWIVYIGVGMTSLNSSPIGRSLTFNLSGFFRDMKYKFGVYILFPNSLIWVLKLNFIILNSKFYLLLYVIRKLKIKTR